jgi:demethoxyubiquinone hydroxylase (CLK1/Coq7/Cat5 family)
LPNVRQEMQQAAIEEQDHLAWCEDRLKEPATWRASSTPSFVSTVSAGF